MSCPDNKLTKSATDFRGWQDVATCEHRYCEEPQRRQPRKDVPSLVSYLRDRTLEAVSIISMVAKRPATNKNGYLPMLGQVSDSRYPAGHGSSGSNISCRVPVIQARPDTDG